MDGTRCGVLVDQRSASYSSRRWNSVYNEHCAWCGWIRLEMMLRLRSLVAEVEDLHASAHPGQTHTLGLTSRNIFWHYFQQSCVCQWRPLRFGWQMSYDEWLQFRTLCCDSLKYVNTFPMWILFIRTYEYGWKRTGGLYIQVQDAFYQSKMVSGYVNKTLIN